MNDLQLRAVLTGLFFGGWPLLMNRSRLNGDVSSAVFCFFALMTVLPLALKSVGHSLTNVNWVMAISAGFLAGLGLLAFNSMLAKANPVSVGTLVILMLVVQIAVPALYQVIVTRHLTASGTIGFAAAVTAAYFLTR
jgi:hypothetical protein